MRQAVVSAAEWYSRHRGDGGIVEALRADVASGAEGAERSDGITILVQEYLGKR